MYEMKNSEYVEISIFPWNRCEAILSLR